MFKKLWEKIKAWAIGTALPWLKKEWLQLVNILVLWISYDHTDKLPWVQTLLGLWIFVLAAYYIFWKFFGVGKLLKKTVSPPVSVKKK